MAASLFSCTPVPTEKRSLKGKNLLPALRGFDRVASLESVSVPFGRPGDRVVIVHEF